MPATASDDSLVAFEPIWPEGAWPCFSPDGRHLVFTGDLERPNNRLRIVDLDGGGDARPGDGGNPVTVHCRIPMAVER